jgi:hypothetical protein
MPKTADHWVELKFKIDDLAASQLAKLKERTGVSTAKYLRGLIDRAMIVEGVCPGPVSAADAGLKVGVPKVKDELGESADGRTMAPARTAKVEAADAEEQARIGVEVDRALLQALKANPDLLANLDDKTLATLAVSRSPKPRDDDGEFRKGVASLREMLSGLPGVEDLTERCADLVMEAETLKARVRELEEQVKRQVPA